MRYAQEKLSREASELESKKKELQSFDKINRIVPNYVGEESAVEGAPDAISQQDHDVLN